MKEKKKEFTPEQIRVLRQNKLDPALWVVLQDCQHTMLIRRKDLSEAKLLNKQ